MAFGAVIGGCIYPLFFPIYDATSGDGIGILGFAFVGFLMTGLLGPFLILSVLRLTDKRRDARTFHLIIRSDQDDSTWPPPPAANVN